jgi:hypothetical protein
MAKRRTGLQSEIAGIFSGVPVPKKGGQRSGSGGPAPKPDDPASKSGGSVIPKPVTPQPMAPPAPTPQRPAESIPPTVRPKVAETKVPEQIPRQIPRKIPRRRKNKVISSKAGTSSARQKAGIILFVLLSAVLVIVVARPFLPSSKNPAIPQSTGNTDAGNSAKNNIKIDWPIPPVYPEDLRDPMELGPRRPTIVETYDRLVVKGIVVSEDLKQAIIGTAYVVEGDIVPGTKTKVKRINPNSVEFEEDGKTWTQEVEGDKK